jgi:hypothetical protein
LVGEEHSVLPITNDVGAALKPKLLPDTVISPPMVGLSSDTKEMEGASEVSVTKTLQHMLGCGRVSLTVLK